METDYLIATENPRNLTALGSSFADSTESLSNRLIHRAVVLKLFMTEEGDSLPWLAAGMILLLVGAGMLLYGYAVLSTPCLSPPGCGGVRGGGGGLVWVAALLIAVGIPFLIQAYRVYSRSG